MLVGWANQLVVRYLEGLEDVKVNYAAYGIVAAVFLGGLSVAIPLVMAGMLSNAPAALQLLQTTLSMGALKYGEYLNAIGVGLLAGSMIFDYRLGSILAGLLGLAAWLA